MTVLAKHGVRMGALDLELVPAGTHHDMNTASLLRAVSVIAAVLSAARERTRRRHE